MAEILCPHCGKANLTEDGWARATVATLVPSPAVPAMANQVRCAGCGLVFSVSVGDARGGWRTFLPALLLLGLLAVVAWWVPG